MNTFEKEITIEDKQITISTLLKAHCGDYTVFENKLWQVFSTSGAGKSFRYGLERESEKNIKLYPEANTVLYKIVKPTGYMKI